MTNPTKILGDDIIINQLYLDFVIHFDKACLTCNVPYNRSNVTKILYCKECFAHQCSKCMKSGNIYKNAKECRVCHTPCPWWYTGDDTPS